MLIGKVRKGNNTVKIVTVSQTSDIQIGDYVSIKKVKENGKKDKME